MTPTSPLDELKGGWEWYEAARQSLRRLDRLAERYWDDLPWQSEVKMEPDNLLGKLSAVEVKDDATSALKKLNDLAVIELFSIFEGIVRTRVAEQVREASVGLVHPMLKAAAKNAVNAAERQSFAEILKSYSQGGHADLAEQVRQVRRYRNWLSHGRRGKELTAIEPKTVYERLRKFLELILPAPTTGAPSTIPDAIP